jgi:probable addiction module antidote protein
MKKLRKFKEVLHEDLKDQQEAKAYIEVALEEYEKDKDIEAFLMALRDVTEAQGGISKLAQRTHLNRQNLYRALSHQGNPKLETIGTILHGLGFKLAIQSKHWIVTPTSLRTQEEWLP